MTDHVADRVARAWAHLDAGDLDAARAVYADLVAASAATGSATPPKTAAETAAGESAETASESVSEPTAEAAANVVGPTELDTAAPEVAFLGAVIADRAGDSDAAMAGYARALALAPAQPRYLLAAADLALAALDDPARAIELCDQALDATDADEDVIHAVLLKVEGLLSLGNSDQDDKEARELLDELADCEIVDPAAWCHAGDLRLALGDIDAAAAAYNSAVAINPNWADGYHGLGAVFHERGDRERMVEAWMRVRTLDLAAPAPQLLEPEEFARIAEAALAELPPNALAVLENVPLLIEDVPSAELVAQGTDPRLLGLFSGTPLPEKSHVSGHGGHLDTIHLFSRNLERSVSSRERLVEEIRITVLHETAHFFGLDDDDLAKIGLD